MKTQFQHIHFDDVSHLYPRRKTSVYECWNNLGDTLLGVVKWYFPWRQYCFYPEGDTILAKSCLVDISYFVIHLK